MPSTRKRPNPEARKTPAESLVASSSTKDSKAFKPILKKIKYTEPKTKKKPATKKGKKFEEEEDDEYEPEDNYSPENDHEEDDDDDSISEASVEENDDFEPEEKPKKGGRAPRSESAGKKKTVVNSRKKKDVKKITTIFKKSLKAVEENQKPVSEEVRKDGGREIKLSEATLEMPFWVQPEHRKDRSGKRPNEEGYDPTSLLIPQEEYDALPKIVKKYWKFKGRYFDKIVAVKMWSCYFFYEMDAITIHKLFDTRLCEMKGRIYTHFHECNLNKYAPKLLEGGHQIVVVEKVKRNQKKDDDRTKKGVCQVLTRGTYTDGIDLGYSSQFCLCVYEQDLEFGLVYFDTTTHEFYLGEFKDDAYRSNLRTLVMKIKPVEIVYTPKYIHQDTLQMFKSLSQRPALSQILFKPGKYPKKDAIMKKVMKYFSIKGGAKPILPDLLLDIKNKMQGKNTDSGKKKGRNDEDSDEEEKLEVEEENGDVMQEEEDHRKAKSSPYFYTLQGLLLSLTHLENVMLADTIFVMGNFMELDLEMEKKSSLYLDCQALENLEILDIGYLSNLAGDYSLFGYMDKAVSPFGKRMFRRWVTAPLFDAESINERLDAVEELLKNPEIVEYYQNSLKGFPDLERIITRTYTLTNKKKTIATHFEEFAKTRLGDFLNLLSLLEKIEPIIEKMGQTLSKSKSKRLRQLTKIKEVNMQAFDKKQLDHKVHSSKNEGMFPKISHLVSDLKEMMQPRDGLLLPAPGMDKQCDKVVKGIDDVKERLQDILDETKEFFNYNSIKYVHTRQRYELEMPEKLLERIPRPKGYVVTSKKKGVLRFHTPEIERCLEQIDEYEKELTRILMGFIVEYFKKFYERSAYWNQVLLCLAELDCLCGLAKLASQMGTGCRPKVLPKDKKPQFQLKDMVHPCVALHNKNFVSNDLTVENDANIFLITGPNMGGKSTFLRQACIAVIMAQIGSFVPASSFTLTCVDRIFTRIGASDRLIEGKSTFFIEMEETYHMLLEASRNSLLVIDELGRGTSTYDGVAIAYAVLKSIASDLKCITLFATHYHLLIEEFKLYDNVVTYCMLSEFDKAKEELTFKYKFAKGEATSSHGLMIAKMAGLPVNVLENAKDKATLMTKEKRNVKQEKMLTSNFNKAIEALLAVQKPRFSKYNEVYEQLSQLK